MKNPRNTLRIQIALITTVSLMLGWSIGLYTASRFIGSFVPELAK